ncbi:MAG TPA: HD domain-containing protein, partial [Dissulfurispiraceae bacterium]|nr:HD domain-containing protein [Dissulfurispiraceae bacterium]
MTAIITTDLSAMAERFLAKTSDGRLIVTALSDMLDDTLLKAFEGVAGASTPGLALVAIGGYGRREQSAFSDVDVMLLGATGDTRIRETAEKVLYRLWDVGVPISHAFRTLKTCGDDAMRDVQIRTSLFDVRHVAGDSAVVDTFRRDTMPRILYKDKKRFLGELLREAEKRHKRFGESLYLLEPNVKEGRGALRDVHTASWIARSCLSLDICMDFGKIFPSRSAREFLHAISYLLRVRAALHCASQRKNDMLSFELQGAVAEKLRLRDTKAFLAPELLLRVYYRKAQIIAETLHGVSSICSRRFFHLPFSFGVRKIGETFAIARNEIVSRDEDSLSRIETILEAFSIFATSGKHFSLHLQEAVRLNTRRMKPAGILSRQSLQSFWAIMRSQRVYETLAEMHRFRVLEIILPEFGRLRNLVIFEIFHRYTVDEHTLFAVRNAEIVRSTKEVKLAHLKELFQSIKPELFFFALILHDIGKGISRRHESIGYRMLKPVLERFAVSAEEGQHISFLVKNHIVFSSLALRRDPESPETIRTLAELVENEENLNALYLMTYADMSAVKPDFWTDWKAFLFRSVYRRTRDLLRGVHADSGMSDDPSVRSFLKTMPDRYRLSQAHEEMIADMSLAEQARAARLVTSLAQKPDGTAELTVISFHMPRLFAHIVGILSRQGLNIARARIYTSTDGVTIRKLLISNWEQLFWAGLPARIEDDLKNEIFSGEHIPLRAARDDRAFLARKFEVFAEVDNEGS